jgi:DNA-binding NtrC family response regulator
VISATHHDLKADVQQGQFREDLYFRLNVLLLVIPPLRQRPEDIVPMAEAFLQRFALMDGLHAKPLTTDAAAYLRAQRWSGNVRALENLMHRALVLSDDAAIDAALLQQLHAVEESAETSSLTHSQPLHINLFNDTGKFKTMFQIEAEAMQKSLHYHGQNITHAAEALDMAKSTFYRKVKEQNENKS